MKKKVRVKQKTKKSVVKRFKVTKSGKVLHRSNFARHLNTKKSSKRKRSLRKPKLTKKAYAKRIRKVLGK